MSKPKVVLHQPLSRPWGSPNLSPFCTKLETYLRMAKIDHELFAANPMKSPKGKIPYVSIDGEYVGDSGHIIERLEKTIDEPLDRALTPEQKAVGRMVTRTFDEAFYFVLIYNRWGSNEGFAVLAPEFKKVVPGPLKVLVGLIRRKVRKSLHTQGTGRHTPDEIWAMGQADIAAFSELLGDKPYLFGDTPSTTDATVFGFIEGVLGVPYDSPLRVAMARTANVAAYRERIRSTYFSDLG